MPTIGENVRRLRIQAGITSQSEFAKLMGVPQPRAADLERDRYQWPKLETLLSAAAAIGCRVDDFLTGLDDRYDSRKDATPVEPAPPLKRSTVRRVVRLLEQMTDDGQRLAEKNVALLVPAFRREKPRGSDEPPSDMPSERGNKGRGKR